MVGGALRDMMLMGTEVDPDSLEWDMATSATPEQVMELFEKTIPTGLPHGTVTVLTSRRRTIEVTTYRGEKGYSDGRHPDQVTYVKDIQEDLARRDFTINAMALDPRDGTLVDPHHGARDLDDRVLRAVGDAAERFSEDGLRPMRAARFVAVLGLGAADGIVEAMGQTLEIFARVSAERKREELVKMMAATLPSRGLRMLGEAGYVPILFPGLERTMGCRQGGYHEHDVWEHTLICVDQCPADDPRLRIAALMHDAGKPGTAGPPQGGEDRVHFHEHEKLGARMARQWLEDLRFSREDQEWIAHVVRHHIVMYRSEWSDAAIRRFIRRVGPGTVHAILDLAIADVKAQGRSGHLIPLAQELRRRVDHQLDGQAAFSLTDLAVDGNDIMTRLDLEPGPMVGKILSELMERVLEEPELNQRERLLSLAADVHAGREETEVEPGGAN